MKNFIITFSLVILASSLAWSQQVTRYSQYRFNPMLINPAASGNIGDIQISTGFKSMWNNIPGSPQTQFVAANGAALRKRIGWGVEVQNDVAGLLKQRKIIGNVAYRHRLGRSKWLSTGIGLGLKQHVFDGTGAIYEDQGDVALPTAQLQVIRPTANFGIMYMQRNAFVGLSAISFIPYDIVYEGIDREVAASSISRFNLIAGYDFKLSKNWVYRQMIQFKFEPKNPTQFDFTPMLEYNKKTAIGLSWRHQESISAIFQTTLSNAFKVGYAYDFQTNGLNTVTNGSHEIMLMYIIDKSRYGYKNPRYF